MKKTLALLLSVLLMVSLLGTAGASQAAGELYETSLTMLQSLLSRQISITDEMALGILASTLQNASGYEQADGFLLYVRVLDGIDKEDYDQAEKDLSLLKEDQGLNGLLADEAFTQSYPAVKPVETLEKYLEGRKAEAADDADAAMAAYQECGEFYDSETRLDALKSQSQEGTVTYAKGYVRVIYGDQSGWLRLPDDEPYIFPLRLVWDDGTVTENDICVTPTGVYMESSTCENQDCVYQGEVTLDNMDERILGNMIICLPNQVCLELYSIEQLLGPSAE